MNKRIRKIILFFLINILIVSTTSITYSENDKTFLVEGMPEIVANGAIVVDVETGYILYEKNAYQKFYPASITKIMTAILAIENLKYEDIVTFSHNAVYSIEPGSSSGYLREGEQITVEQCLQGLMLISGNDIANGLAEAVAGTTEGFAVMMTNKAKELGSINTNFKNAHGLEDDEHYTCAYDMALFARYAYNTHEKFKTLISTLRVQIPETPYCNEIRYWKNSNRMIHEGTEYYDADCVGGKTGYTTAAGGSLVTYHNINGRTVLIVLLNDTNSAGAYVDTLAMCKELHDKLDEKLISKINEAYKAEKESESVAANSSNVGKVDLADDADDTVTDNTEEKSFPLIVKILLVLVVIFIIYYFYISMERKKRRRRRRHKVHNKRPDDEIDIIYKGRR